MFNNFFSRNNVEIYSKAGQPAGDNIMVAYALCMLGTDTRLECVILIAFPRQQWLRERASMLRYTYIACLCLFQFFINCSNKEISYVSSVSLVFPTRQTDVFTMALTERTVHISLWEILHRGPLTSLRDVESLHCLLFPLRLPTTKNLSFSTSSYYRSI